MGIDLATWRARIGLNYYHKCRPLQTRWKSSGRLYQPGVASWGVGEVMNDTPLVLKGCMTVVALSLILQYVAHSCSKLKGRGGSSKVHCHWLGTTFQARGTVDGRVTLLLGTIVVIPLLLVIAGDVERNPGPGGNFVQQRCSCSKTVNTVVQTQLFIEQVYSILFFAYTEPSLTDILAELYPIRTHWYKIGLQLQIPHLTLEHFKHLYSDSSDLMREVLKHWLSTAADTHVTWKAVVRALRSPLVDMKDVAEQLESKYCEPIQCSGSTSSLLNEWSRKPPFGCGCGKCTVFIFIEGGCPMPILPANSFPYLQLSGLTHEEQRELSGRLWSESQEIMIQFQKLVLGTITSLKRRSVPLGGLVSLIKTLGIFSDPVLKEIQDFSKLKPADTIPKVFMFLNDYFSFFNHHIIELIINKFGTEKDKAELKKYKDSFNQYAKRRLFECLPEFGPVSDADHADLFVKVDSQYEDYTIAQTEGFCHKLSEVLHFSSQGILRLCRIDKGCFQLMFQIPALALHKIFPLSREQQNTLAAIGVIRLTCGEYQLQVKLCVCF